MEDAGRNLGCEPFYQGTNLTHLMHFFYVRRWNHIPWSSCFPNSTFHWFDHKRYGSLPDVRYFTATWLYIEQSTSYHLTRLNAIRFVLHRLMTQSIANAWVTSLPGHSHQSPGDASDGLIQPRLASRDELWPFSSTWPVHIELKLLNDSINKQNESLSVDGLEAINWW